MDKPPIDFDEPEPPYDVKLTIREVLCATVFIASLLVIGFVLGRVSV